MGTQDPGEILLEYPQVQLEQITDESPARETVIRHGFYIQTTEVTQNQWFVLMGTRPGPRSHWQRPDWRQLPVVSVSWHDTQDFIAKLNQRENGRRYRLPSEAEWEYVAKDGGHGMLPFASDKLDQYAWYKTNSDDKPQPIASKKPNQRGIYDLFGNAWEWVQDDYHNKAYAHPYSEPTSDTDIPSTSAKKVRRGGSYHCPPELVRSAYRAADRPNKRYSVLGFRLVLEESGVVYQNGRFNPLHPSDEQN